MATSASKRVDDIRKEGEKTIKSVSRAAEKELESAAKTTRRQARKVAKRAGKIEDQATGYVKDNPYAALGIAAGIGVIAGALLARR
ncbi:MAG: YqjD family protein [Glycocaulis sp.]